MSIPVSCPRCGQPVEAQARQCPQCGVDLARAALLAEYTLKTATLASAPGPMRPEILVPRLGEYLLERGVLSEGDLQKALDVHLKRAAEGHPRLLGQVLLELGLVDAQTLDQVVTEQILQLQEALQQANRQLEQRVQERTHELEQALSKLSELNQLKSNFIANVSHELRTPLTHIKGYLDLMADGSLGTLSEDQVNALNVLLRSESRLEELIEELIQFTLAASGEIALQMDKVLLKDLIAAAVDQSRVKAANKGITVELMLAEHMPAVQVDIEKITWVLMELVDNAIKFTPDGGRVRIETRMEHALATVAVMDSGIGIPAGRIQEIFEPFHQLDGSIRRRHGGVGLGLALVNRIIEAHGSLMKVESVEGRGSRFEFTLPLCQDV